MKAVVITGSNGEIGSSIAKLLKENEYAVFGIDKSSDQNNLDDFLQIDLRDLVICEKSRENFYNSLSEKVHHFDVKALINNAAIQILCSLDELPIEDFRETIDINLNAPFVLSKLMFPFLKRSKGSIINIGSVHANLTKPKFVAYSTSKAGIAGLTKALAVDIGEYVKVNGIHPAAIETKMLLSGFSDDMEKYAELKKFHPTKCIGKAKEVANIVNFLISDSCPFMNGATIDLSGGVSSRLHDPN